MYRYTKTCHAESTSLSRLVHAYRAGTSTLSNVLVMNCINTSVVVSGSGTAVKIQNSIFYSECNAHQ